MTTSKSKKQNPNFEKFIKLIFDEKNFFFIFVYFFETTQTPILTNIYCKILKYKHEKCH